jgi:hypothetical protein
VTERELDRTKNELVRALRRRAAEIDVADDLVLSNGPTPTTRPGMVAMRPRKERVAFFARDTFRNAVLTPASSRLPE